MLLIRLNSEKRSNDGYGNGSRAQRGCRFDIPEGHEKEISKSICLFLTHVRGKPITFSGIHNYCV